MPLWLSALGKAFGAGLGWLIDKVAPVFLAYLAGLKTRDRQKAETDLKVTRDQLDIASKPVTHRDALLRIMRGRKR